MGKKSVKNKKIMRKTRKKSGLATKKKSFVNTRKKALSSISTKALPKSLKKISSLRSKNLRSSNPNLSSPKHPWLPTDPLFDAEGFSNSSVLFYYRNQVVDRIITSDRLREKLTTKIQEIENQVIDFAKWTNLIEELDYVRLDHSHIKSKIFIKNSEAQLKDINEMMKEVDAFHHAIDGVTDDTEYDSHFLKNLDLFVVCSEIECLRWGKVFRGPSCYILNSLSITEEPSGARIITFQKFSSVTNCPISTLFMDLKWDGQVQARIQLGAFDDGNACFSRLEDKLLHCLPHPAKGSKLSSVIRKSPEDSPVITGSQESGSSGDFELSSSRTFLMEDLNMECKFNLITNVEGLNTSDILEVTSGGYLLRQMLLSKFYQSIIIEESGLIMSKNK